ncbi:hypothetical protein V8J36_09825 [Frigidibacter sp. MR17.14]|uniref:hypothetical protein n=1 Tax=Frigidibacter sp. MR17.14 TaxID=3126509 RepID=UPI003012D94D
MIFLREVPQKVAEGVASGLYEVTGSVVRDVATGRGVAFLQETGLAEKLLSSALQGVTSTLSNGLNPLSIVSVIQNQQIKNRLAEVQASLGLL